MTLVHAGALGDTVLLAPLLRSLQQRWPHCRRTVVMRTEFGRMLMRMNLAEACTDADSPQHSRWFAPPDPRGAVAGVAPAPAWADCDLLLSAVADGHDSWAANARLFSTAAIHFFQPRPPPDFARSVPEFHRLQLAELHLPPALLPPPRRQRFGPIVLAPGAGSPRKCLPLTDFMTLARLIRGFGHAIRFVLGPVEEEKFLSADTTRLNAEFDICKCEKLNDLLDLLDSAAGFIGNDSGPAHLSAALGLPTLALFSAGDPRQWSPIGPLVRVAAAPTADSLLAAAQNQVPWLLADRQQP